MNMGAIRRIDSLGRIVMPKSIRKELKIKSGDNLEVFMQGKRIIIEKHSELEKIENISKIIAELLKETLNSKIYITDKNKIIYTKEKAENKELEEDIEKLIIKRSITQINNLKLTKDITLEDIVTINPILAHGDIYGFIVINPKEKLTEENISTVKLLTKLLTKLLED